MDETYLYAGNLPHNTDEAMLNEVCAKYGTVVKVYIARSKAENTKGLFRGYAFVQMSSKKEVENIIYAVNGKEIGGRSCFLGFGMEYKDLWDSAFS